MRGLLALSLVVLTACGGPGSFDGTVQGNTLPVKESVFFRGSNVASQTGSVASGSGVVIALSDKTHLCDMLKNNQLTADSTSFIMLLGVSQGGLTFTDVLSTGKYRLFNPLTDIIPPLASGTRLTFPIFTKLDGQCQNGLGANGAATGGSVTLDHFDPVNGGFATGSFDLAFNSDNGQGTFNAPFCDYQPPASNPAPTCQ
jgi:hypothetical protein